MLERLLAKWRGLTEAMLERLLAEWRGLIADEDLGEAARGSRFRQFLRFWVVVGRGFSANRCPVRASALAYSSLLAFIPFLALVIGIATSLLRNETDRIRNSINEVVGRLVPQLAVNPEFVEMKDKIVSFTLEGIEKVNSGTLGTAGVLTLLVVIIFMLARIEETLNDIWGVPRGRTWYARVVNYWAAISLGPFLIFATLSFSAALQFDRTQAFLQRLPLVGSFLISLVPIPVLGGACALFYILVPNTKVRWRAAVVGGLTAGLLWHLNNSLAFMAVAQVKRNSELFGNLVPIPVFVAGLYLFWVVLLFGAQVAYAFQNRRSQLAVRQSDRVHQGGRELVAMRVMIHAAASFRDGKASPSVASLADRLEVPTELVSRIVNTLVCTRLLVEVNGPETGLQPARPLDQIRVADILSAMRRGTGTHLPTRADEGRVLAERELEGILAAETSAGSRTLAELVAASPAA